MDEYKELQELCSLRAPSGLEDQVRSYLRGRAEKLSAHVKEDAMGNLIVLPEDTEPDQVKMMLCAHMDENGVIIKSADENGFLRFAFIGDIDPRTAVGKRVRIGEKNVLGTIGMKAVHLTTPEEREKIPRSDELYIDIGTHNREEALKIVKEGDCGTFECEFGRVGEDLVQGKALDSRVCCRILLRILESHVVKKCAFVFTTQYHVRARGAFAAAFSVRPQFALVLDGICADAGKDGEEFCIGPVIPFMDEQFVYSRVQVQNLIRICQDNGILWHTGKISDQPSEPASLQMGSGCQTSVIKVPVRYLNTPVHLVRMQDMEDVCKIAEMYCKEIVVNE